MSFQAVRCKGSSQREQEPESEKPLPFLMTQPRSILQHPGILAGHLAGSHWGDVGGSDGTTAVSPVSLCEPEAGNPASGEPQVSEDDSVQGPESCHGRRTEHPLACDAHQSRALFATLNIRAEELK